MELKRNIVPETKLTPEGEEPFYIVCCECAGDFIGHILRRDGREVWLGDVREVLFQGYDVFELALNGPENADECTVSAALESACVLDAVLMVRCTERAAAKILGSIENRD